MTKQFTLDETTSDLIICDNGEPRFWVDEYDDIIEIIDLLNELNDEIKYLKYLNKDLKQELNDVCHKELEITLGFIKSKGYGLKDLKEYEERNIHD